MLQNLRELLKYKALIEALVVRHLASRYRGSALGFLWSFLNPLCLMAVYTVVFHYYMRAASVENYTIFLFCGLLQWIWVTSALNEGAASITSGGHLITKSMFPAHILPFVSVTTTGINFLLALPLLFIFVVVSRIPLHWTMLFVPVLVLIQFIFLHGLALILSSLNVRFRDVQHIVTNILTLIFFLCPIVYPLSAVPERFRFTIDLNPFALFTVSYQSLILNNQMPTVTSIVFLLCSALIMFWIGTIVFDKYRESFAELL